MVLSELIQRSPIRIFEQSINGGLKPGEIGVIASPNGVGKTSVLVQLALDKLLQGKKVIHVSFTQHNQYVPLWYEDIFTEFTNKKNLENAAEIKNDLVKNRVLMNFSQDGVTKEQIIRSLRAMIIEGGFRADSIIIDGFDFFRLTNDGSQAEAGKESINKVKDFATELGVSVWYSCSVKDDGANPLRLQYDKENIPVVLSDYTDYIDVVIVLQPKPDHVELSISKDRNS
ncbi:MAG: helicase RepA family protein, partial [Treponema sp.]|nr:helicase RepA family protein [Treponema sp.]